MTSNIYLPSYHCQCFCIIRAKAAYNFYKGKQKSFETVLLSTFIFYRLSDALHLTRLLFEFWILSQNINVENLATISSRSSFQLILSFSKLKTSRTSWRDGMSHLRDFKLVSPIEHNSKRTPAIRMQ